MKEELITFETAKLAKEKGFNEYCENAFDVYNNKNISENIKDETAIEFFDGFVEDLHGYKNYRGTDAKENYLYRRDISDDMWLLRPTQSLLQKWLREVHNVSMLPSFNDNNADCYYYFIHTNTKKAYSNRICSLKMDYSTYEEALEKGLQEALKLIK